MTVIESYRRAIENGDEHLLKASSSGHRISHHESAVPGD